ncbi:hypothetical protein FCK90_05665 [Kocuria coralli]|uniref:Uncharacterized protein n=1 Tax=Kocuria coralli TaxID=1461025 RepID=A0A5J5L0S2_9MICC|nr:hypothetical protein [Kocuria coralli]KAA9394656.1 hypothetical protein FCK90_05665 [Kocuria coralli]
MGLFSRKSNTEQQTAGAPNAEAAPAAQPLPAEGPLRNLVAGLVADGADRGKLTLVQRGNTMSQQTERSVGGNPTTDGGTVDQAHPLFEDVAALYTEAMSRDTGAWQTAVIEVGPDSGRGRLVQVDYDFPAAPHSTERYQLGGGAGDAAAAAPGAPAAGTAGQGSEAPGTAGTAETPGTTGTTGTAEGRESAPESRVPADSADSGADSGTGTAAGVGSGALAAAAAEGRGEAAEEASGTAEPEAQPRPEAPQPVPAPQAPAAEADRGEEPASEPAPVPPTVTDAVEPGPGSQDDVPQHVDHEEWRDDDAGRSGAQATGAAAAGAASGAGARASAGSGEGDAPSMAQTADVAPSYRAGEVSGRAPSKDKLAEGNKVLTEADVLGRLAGAQRRLFGAEGTALDVSTVLIRVRTLGTYYDALTHVRQGGFWDQRPSFDLVPEEELKVQELKEDSYVEGQGAPLAMMFRFRPGIPPEVSFDYADEEAFVRYPERLPSQNYVEELRMYPRTGANIPAHVNDALQDWNY